MQKVDLSHLLEKWPSSIVARTEIKAFTGGLVSSGTMANVDSLGTGPEGSFMYGKKKAYNAKKLVEWLERRVSVNVPPSVRYLGR